MRTITCTAAALNAMICFTSAGATPPIAFNRDNLAEPLAAKLRAATEGKERSDHVQIHFGAEEKELQEQFEKCAEGIASIFNILKGEGTKTPPILTRPEYSSLLWSEERAKEWLGAHTGGPSEGEYEHQLARLRQVMIKLKNTITKSRKKKP